jgi:hypothetical protein
MWQANEEEEHVREEEKNRDKTARGVRWLGTAIRGHRFDCAAYHARDTY